MAENCVTEDHVKVSILQSEKSSREENDKRYAPAHVKVVVYSLIGIAASGIIFGTIQSYTGGFIKTFAPFGNNVQAYDNTE